MREGRRAVHRWAVVVALALLAVGVPAEAAKLVTGRTVKDASLTGRDIKDRSIGGKDVGSYAIGSRHLDDTAVEALTGPPGAPGLQGPQGPQGSQGPQGPVGVANITVAQGQGTACAGTADCSIASAVASCPAGTRALGGGYATDSGFPFAAAIGYDASAQRGGYVVGIDNYGAQVVADIVVFAYCSPGVQSVTFPNGVQWRSLREARTDVVRDRLHKRRG